MSGVTTCHASRCTTRSGWPLSGQSFFSGRCETAHSSSAECHYGCLPMILDERARLDATERGSRSPSLLAVSTVAALSVLLVIQIGASLGLVEIHTATVVLAVASTAHGAHTFWTSGGRLVTASGAVGISLSVLVGGATLYSFTAGSEQATFSYLNALSAAFGVQVVVAAATANSWRRFERRTVVMRNGPATVTGRSAALAGLLIAVLGSAGHSLGIPYVGDAGAFVGTVVAFAAAFRTQMAQRLDPVAVVAAVLAAMAYGLVVFDGFGRLNLVSIGIAVAILAAPRFSRRRVKLAALGSILPLALLLASSRISLSAARTGSVNPDVSGFESGINPMLNYARFWSDIAAGDLAPTGGRSLLGTMLVWVPRTLWEDKPVGFGREITAYLNPTLLRSNHSSGALFVGEGIWNFGLLLGIAFSGAVLIGLVLLAEWLLARAPGEVDTWKALVVLTLAVVLAAGLPNYLWNGSFTQTSRLGRRLLVIAALAALTLARGSKGSAPSSSHPSPRTTGRRSPQRPDESLPVSHPQ